MVTVSEPEKSSGRKIQGKPDKSTAQKISLNYIDYCRLPNLYSENDEKAEIKISKHALLEAMFQTQLWTEPYISNPFIYITDNPGDFKGEQGVKLQEYFKRVFFDQYTKYSNALIQATKLN